MTNSAHFEPAPLNGLYAVELFTATATGSLAGLAFGLVQHVDGQKADPLLWTAAIAAAISAGLTADAMKRWLRSRRRAPRPFVKPLATVVLTKLPAQLKRLALPAPAKPKPAPREEAKAQARPETPRPNARMAAALERIRLAELGHTPEEISRILVEREIGGHGAASLGSGIATGFLNNLDAILTHVRAWVPSFKADLEHMLDTRADKATRISGALSFAVKTAALGVFGYFLYIEAFEFRARAYKTWAEACIQRQQNAINHSTLPDLSSGVKLDGDDECETRRR